MNVQKSFWRDTERDHAVESSGEKIGVLEGKARGELEREMFN